MTNTMDRTLYIHLEELLTALDNNGLYYRIIEKEGDEEKKLNNWLETKFPMQSYACINWNIVKDSVIYHWDSWDEMRFSLKKILDSIKNEPDSLIYIVWADASFPLFEITFRALSVIGEIILDEDFDVWLVSLKDNWCIEKYHEGTLSFGFHHPCRSPLIE
jgi:hypothetical protein